jgi:hypothetical protein
MAATLTALPDAAVTRAMLRHDVMVGLTDAGVWVETHQGAEIPSEWTVQLPVPDGTYERKRAWLDRVAASWNEEVTEGDGWVMTEKRFGPSVRLVAVIRARDYTEQFLGQGRARGTAAAA